MSRAAARIAGTAVVAALSLTAAAAQQSTVPSKMIQQIFVTPSPLYGSGFGEVSGYPFGPESLVIFLSYERNSTTVHARNVGSRALSVDLTFKCGTGGSCPPPRSFVVQPVSIKTDASQDQTYAVPGPKALPFEWGVRLVDDGIRQLSAGKQQRPIIANGSGQTNGSGVRVGDQWVKFFVATDSHSTGIYVRNVGKKRVHIKLQPTCAPAELCPPLDDAIVPPVADPNNGANDYIYTVRVVNMKLPFSWTVWIPSDVSAR